MSDNPYDAVSNPDLERAVRALEAEIGEPARDWEQRLLERLANEPRRESAAPADPAPNVLPLLNRAPTPGRRRGATPPMLWLLAAASLVLIVGGFVALRDTNTSQDAVGELPPNATPASPPSTTLANAATTRPVDASPRPNASPATSLSPPLSIPASTTFPTTPTRPSSTSTTAPPCGVDKGSNGAYPAENATTSGSAVTRCAAPGYHGTGYLGSWTGEPVTFTINVPNTRRYVIRFRYQNAGPPALRQLTIDGSATTLTFNATTNDWNAGGWVEITTSRTLKAGTNTITLSGDTGYIDLDEITSITP